MQNRKIPENIKRKLRQEAGFGCCKCGNPILEYHHIKKWSQVKKHDINYMMVLCPTCHYSIDSYTEEKQLEFKKNPFNHKQENQAGQLIISQNVCIIDTGLIKLIGDGPIITSCDQNYLEFYVSQDNLLELSLRLYNQNILYIKKNDWFKGDAELWDIEFISQSRILKIREKKGKISLEINASKTPVIVKGTFWINGSLLTFSSQGIEIGGNKLSITSNDNTQIFYLEKDAPNIKSSGVSIDGFEFFSGCSIDIADDNTLNLKIKPIPYEFCFKNLKKNKRNEQTLIQTINSFKLCKKPMTIIQDFNNPFLDITKFISKNNVTIPFEKKLALYYALTDQSDKAIETYSKIKEKQQSLFIEPNFDLAEICLEMSYYMNDQKLYKESKENFIIAYKKFGADLDNSFNMGYNVVYEV